jgi:hypothetical protein
LTRAARGRRSGERGLVRGCCAGLTVLVVLAALALVLVLLIRTSGTPDLGAPPVGPDDGQSPAAIATALGSEVEAQLASPGARGAAILVSEQDLSTLAATGNPDPEMFSAVRVRARDGQLWVTADSHLGPLPVVVTARLILSLGSDGSIVPDVVELDVGSQPVPAFMRSAIDPRGEAAISLAPLLSGANLSQFGLECLVVVQGRGVQLGFHDPLLSPDPGYCASHPLSEATDAG